MPALAADGKKHAWHEVPVLPAQSAGCRFPAPFCQCPTNLHSPHTPPHFPHLHISTGGLLKLEDILPFFPDFVMIDNFKDAICDSLERYNRQVLSTPR